jgi:hypothetical protein
MYMKKSIENHLCKSFFGILILLSQFSFAQMSEDFSFMGMLQTTDRQMITYKIDVTINDGVVSGSSLMDIDGPNATTSSLTGTYDYKTKLLSFTEDKVLSSKAPLDGDFCFISIAAQMTVKKNKSHLTGDFWGLVDKKDSCVVGEVSMIATAYIMKTMARVEKVVKKTGTKDSTTLANSDLDNFVKSINTQSISSTESVSISAVSDKCLLKIWDDGIEDGDMVNVKLNGILVLHNYTLKKDEKVIGITLQKGENTIELVALNTGDRFPNTAFLSVEDADSKTKLSSNLEKDQTAIIKVVY